jgi:nucleosome binding factor SPN SPT16 subunit
MPINFDMPIEDLFFTGCPAKSSVKIRPTHNKCLIAISEFPSFVIDVNDIEVVHFERVTFGIKNFDMAIIYKDFMTFKRINSIPRENIEELKEYLDSVGIIFSESIAAFSWPAVLTKIRNDFESFLNDDGGWKFLQDDDDDEAKLDDSEPDDPEFGEEESDDESDDGSDFSEEEQSEEESSDPASESEEGLSWDEMEKRALDEDKKQAARRQEINRARGKQATTKKGRR